MEWEHDLMSPAYLENMERAEWEPSRWSEEHRRREEELMAALSPRPSFRGVGPRGYRRNDVRILEDVMDALTFQDLLDATDVEVAVTDGVVTLSGAVSHRGDRHAAEDLVADVPGVRDVHNNLRVRTARETEELMRKRQEAIVDEGRHGGPWSAQERS
ncbi:MAG: BON domain-containing protein [Myxococcota bacterium]